MDDYRFNDLAEDLRTGREIEFAYNGKRYSITNHDARWWLCCDTDGPDTEQPLCDFGDKDTLVKQIAARSIGSIPVIKIFDDGLYEKAFLCVL